MLLLFCILSEVVSDFFMFLFFLFLIKNLTARLPILHCPFSRVFPVPWPRPLLCVTEWPNVTEPGEPSVSLSLVNTAYLLLPHMASKGCENTTRQATGNLKKDTEKTILKTHCVSTKLLTALYLFTDSETRNTHSIPHKEKKKPNDIERTLNININVEYIFIKWISPCLWCFLTYPTGHWVYSLFSWSKRRGPPLQKFLRF